MNQTNRYLAWGRAHRYRHAVARPPRPEAVAPVLHAADAPVLAYGRGRSYGDSCLNDEGLLIDTRRLDRFIAFDPASGVLEAEAGVRLADVLAHVCRADADGSAWFLPVVPGTRWVSLGGAIANDVHGKNHHRFGSFGCHLESFRLLRSDGRVLHCSMSENSELYRATIGGLGLTGLILSCRLTLRRVPGLLLLAEDIRMGSLDEFYALSAASEAGWEYAVAWVDCLARGRDLGRGIFSRANHVPGAIGSAAPLQAGLGVPLSPPFSPLNRLTLRLFNTAYRNRLGWKRTKRRLVAYAPSLFPLDAIDGWNRLYGARGFYQYQCVLPPDSARAAATEMLRATAAAGEGSFLAVLKTMGARRSPGLLSFPMPGTTLALDFPNRDAATLALLDRLDAITLEARGRVYPAKDGRMSPAMFASGQPELERFRPNVDPGFSSSFWRRVAGAGGANETMRTASTHVLEPT